MSSEEPILGILTLRGAVGLFLYLAAMVVCLVALRQSGRHPSRSARADTLFWRLVVLALATLAAWKAVGLETILHDWMRHEAELERWYENRRLFQVVLMAAAFGIGLLGAIAVTRRLGARPASIRAAGWALAALCSFIVVRSISIHVVDRILFDPIGPIRLNWIIEPGLIFIIAAAAHRYVRNPPWLRLGGGRL